MGLQHKKIHQLRTFIPVFLGMSLVGMNEGWLSPFLKRSQEPGYDVSLNSDQCSWIVALNEPAKVCGVIITMCSIDLLGRRKILFATSLLNLFGWTMIRVLEPIAIIFVSRFMFGIVTGSQSCTHMIYVGENSSPESRGTFITIRLVFLSMGLVAGGTFATYFNYDTVAAINIVISLITFLSCFLAKETVQFLLMKGNYDQAKENYNWLFPENKNELENMHNYIRSNDKPVKMRNFFNTPAHYKGTAIALISVTMLTSTGFFTIPPFASMLFVPTSALTANEFTICLRVIQVVSSLAPTLFIESFNRRTILITALIIAGSAHANSAILYYVHCNITRIPMFPWLIFTSITSFLAAGMMGMLPIMQILTAELFPQNMKSIGNGLNTFSSSTVSFVISATFLKIGQKFGYFANFLFFSVNCWVALIFVYFFVPETKGKSLVEIQTLLLHGKSNVEAASKHSEERDQSNKEKLLATTEE